MITPVAERNTSSAAKYGGIAQLGERLNGIQEVSGSIPLISTKHRSESFGVFLFSERTGKSYEPFSGSILSAVCFSDFDQENLAAVTVTRFLFSGDV